MTYTDEQRRCIDMLVAEKIMGWAWTRGLIENADDPSYDNLVFREYGLEAKTFLPHYTTDHNSCAEMRGRLRELDKHVTLGIAIADILDATPLQQCLAALAACGVDVEKELKNDSE